MVRTVYTRTKFYEDRLIIINVSDVDAEKYMTNWLSFQAKLLIQKKT